MIGQDAPEASPMIASETTVSRVPIFAKKGCSPIGKTLDSPKLLQAKLKQLETNKAPFLKYLKPQTGTTTQSACHCQDILIADDDPFQHLYYETFFQKSPGLKEKRHKGEALKLDLNTCGEDMIKKFSALHLKCNCKKLKMIITDYQMGKDKMNGAETAEKLRVLGYLGPILLRTSEIKSELIDKHPKLEKIVNYIIDKSTIKEGEEIFIQHLKTKEGSGKAGC